MNKPKSVTSLQLTMSIGTSIIGVGILAFPRITVNLTSTAAPITTMIAVCISILGGLVLVYLGRQYPDHTLCEYGELLIGKWAARIVVCILGCYFLDLGALGSREFGEVVVTSVLPRTPIHVTVLVILLLVGIASRHDVAKFVRILTFYMPLVYFPALIIVVLCLKNARAANLMPMLAVFHGIPFSSVALSVSIIAALFQNFLVTGLIIPFMYQPERAWKSVTIGIASAGGLYVLLVYSTLSVFGMEEMKNLLWPTLELAKTAALPSFFVERLDPVFLAVWVTAVFCAIYAAYYLAIQSFSHVFGLRDHRVLSIACLPLVLVLAKQPQDIFNLYTTVRNVGLCGLPLTFGYPLILVITHLVKHRIPGKRSRRVKTA